MTDHELLEAAAKAAGYTIEYWAADDYPVVSDGDKNVGWNPLVYDSDALRLAVKLHIELGFTAFKVWANWPYAPSVCCEESFEGADQYAATRRTIVRAAAELAK